MIYMKKLNRELLKLKNTKIYIYSIYFSLLLIGMLVVKDIFMSESVSRVGLNEWVKSNIMIGNFIFIHAISITFITLIFQREYANNIVQNILPYLERKSSFIIEKIITWFRLHLIMTLISFLLTMIGGLIIFKGLNLTDYIISLITLYFKTCILGFAILLPNLIICIVQRNAFILSLISGAVSIILSVGFLQSSNILPYILPWSSAFILIFNANNPYVYCEVTSILILSLLSLIVSIKVLKKQEF